MLKMMRKKWIALLLCLSMAVPVYAAEAEDLVLNCPLLFNTREDLYLKHIGTQRLDTISAVESPS